MSHAVTYERRGTIGLITLNRPENRNSMTPELLAAFVKAVAAARADSTLRCVVITGSGRCFSAGADFKSNIQIGDDATPAHERSYAMYEPFLSVLDIEVPVIGALNGHTVGGGFGLALVTDVRIGSDVAKYGANFARLGLHPGMAISWLLPRLIGVQQAAELLFTGRLMLGDEAARLGLLSRAVPPERVFDEAWQVAEQIAGNAPLAIRLMKRTFYEGLAWEPKRAAFQEAWAQAVTVATADAREGMRALLEKRTPEFTGK